METSSGTAQTHEMDMQEIQEVIRSMETPLYTEETIAVVGVERKKETAPPSSPRMGSAESTQATYPASSFSNLRGQAALVLGATSVIGRGALQQLLQAGCRVMVVARTEGELKRILHEFAEDFKGQLIGIVGELGTRSQIEEIRAVAKAALNGESVDHVVSAISTSDESLTPEGITSADLGALRKNLDETLFPTVLCAQVLLQDLRGKPGATYTILSGGYAHRCYTPNSWVATITDAAMNGAIASLACDTADAPVRVNGNCLHYRVNEGTGFERGREEQEKVSSAEFGRTFIRIIERKDLKGEIVCHDSPQDTSKFLCERLGYAQPS